MLDTWNNLIKECEASQQEVASLRIMADCAYMFSASQKEETDAFNHICFRLARAIIKVMNMVANATGYITPTPKATAKAMTIDPFHDGVSDWALLGNDPVRFILVELNVLQIMRSEPERLLDIMAGVILAGVYPMYSTMDIRHMRVLINHMLGLDIRFAEVNDAGVIVG
ncbi:hypothetical protein [Allisonella histaminiformans]|uniref:hypothetical protein n=1 Tax=Allisonella histaminiformans TaxID=209880 RepID=UPI002E7634CB|nr:hypothetical protein [Allisonella histaminiformans]